MPAGAIALTASGNVGPGQATGTITIPVVNSMLFDFLHGTLLVTDGNGNETTFQYSAITTVTFTPASKTVSFS